MVLLCIIEDMCSREEGREEQEKKENRNKVGNLDRDLGIRKNREASENEQDPGGPAHRQAPVSLPLICRKAFTSTF